MSYRWKICYKYKDETSWLYHQKTKYFRGDTSEQVKDKLYRFAEKKNQIILCITSIERNYGIYFKYSSMSAYALECYAERVKMHFKKCGQLLSPAGMDSFDKNLYDTLIQWYTLLKTGSKNPIKDSGLHLYKFSPWSGTCYYIFASSPADAFGKLANAVPHYYRPVQECFISPVKFDEKGVINLMKSL